MHIPFRVLEPEVVITTAAAAAATIGCALARVRQTHQTRTVPMMGVAAAGIFAAQMVNFPVPLVPASGHLSGSVLAAVLLGPWAGMIVVSVVLGVQAILFGDGGLDALGANIVNLAVLGAGGGYCVFTMMRRLFAGRAGIAAAAVVAAWFSVLLAAIALAVQLVLSGYELVPTMSAVLFVHLLIGIGEALITGVVVAFLLRMRPGIFTASMVGDTPLADAVPIVVGGLAIALVVAVFCSPFASELPDGLSWATAQIGTIVDESPQWAPFAGYQLPLFQHHAAVATSAAGLIGTLIVFMIAWKIGRSLCPAAPEPVPDAP